MVQCMNDIERILNVMYGTFRIMFYQTRVDLLKIIMLISDCTYGTFFLILH